MASIKFFKVNALPSTLEANSMYFVENGNYAESYLTDNLGVAKAIGNSTMIKQVARELTHTHTQGVPATVWTVVHNLGYYSNVRVVDSSGAEYVGDVKDIDTDSLTITFSAAFAGSAYLS